MAASTPPNPSNDPTAPGKPAPPPGYKEPETSIPTEGPPLHAETAERKQKQRSTSIWLGVIGLLGVAIIFALIAIFGGFFGGEAGAP